MFLAPPVRFTSKSDTVEVVTCSAQSTAQLTAEVSDYDAQVCDGFAPLCLLSDFFFLSKKSESGCQTVDFEPSVSILLSFYHI